MKAADRQLPPEAEQVLETMRMLLWNGLHGDMAAQAVLQAMGMLATAYAEAAGLVQERDRAN